ncbi:MAG: 6-phosphogluconolactonase [Anaerolineae bacterium]|nr:6-phosphogluconolactonase [Anaerolineae bacterium]
MSKPEIQLFHSPDAFYDHAAQRFVRAAKQAIQQRGVFTCALAGGNTPLELYRQLASPHYRNQVPWRKVHFFWGDERCVPPDHPESNYFNAYKSFIEPLSIPSSHVHRIKGELLPDLAIQDYARLLQKFASKEAGAPPWPVFDLVILGLGEDGHIASIFPGSEETNSPIISVSAQYQGRPAHRISLTPLVFNHARQIFFLVRGKNKHDAFVQSLSGRQDLLRWPAQRIRPIQGSVTWIVDCEAAGDAINQIILNKQRVL